MMMILMMTMMMTTLSTNQILILMEMMMMTTMMIRISLMKTTKMRMKTNPTIDKIKKELRNEFLFL
ncbi:hypothetical protein D3C87_2124620 [compost metagenome]